jgi:hypothetical protein
MPQEVYMAKLVTIYESFIETGNLNDVRTPARTSKPRRTHSRVTRARAAESAIYGLSEAQYEEWPTEELCERAKLLGVSIETMSRAELIEAIRNR